MEYWSQVIKSQRARKSLSALNVFGLSVCVGAALLIMLCIQVFAAQEQSAAPMRIDPEPGFTTCIEDTDGNTITRNGVPNTNALAEFGHAAQIDSYSIYYNGRLLMTVTPVGFSAPDKM